MSLNTKKGLFLSLYYLSPIIASIIYLFEEPVAFSLVSSTALSQGPILYVFQYLIHTIASIIGIFSFIWMCFNIIIMIKMKGIEKNFTLRWLVKFHTVMAVIALFLGIAHAPLVMLKTMGNEDQIVSGTIGLLIFIILMIFAIIFMSNRLLSNTRIEALRSTAYERKFRYGVNKFLHNITVLAVGVIFFHTLISNTSKSSMLMVGVYFFFFDVTIIGWVSHKVVRKLRVGTDPYLYRKVSWDTLAEVVPWLYQGANNDWAIQLIKQNPSLYPCLQCGTCTGKCPVSIFTEGEYNSRKLIQWILKGLKDKVVIDMEPNVWQCTQCYTCAENCPQHVKLPDIILFLRNKLAERGEAPDGFLSEAEAVYNNGVSIPLQNAVIRRRKILGLPPIPKFDIQEIQDIMDMAGLNDIILKHVVTEKEDIDTKHILEEKSEVKPYIGGS